MTGLVRCSLCGAYAPYTRLVAGSAPDGRDACRDSDACQSRRRRSRTARRRFQASGVRPLPEAQP